MTSLKQLATTSMPEEIEHHLKSYNYTITKLSELTSIDPNRLCGFLKGHSSWTFNIDQLNAIGQAFGKPVGWLYDLYAEECFKRGRVSKKRIKPFLIQCVELGRQDCIQKVISRLSRYPVYIEVLFDVAEQLFYKGKQKESISFYQLIIDKELDISQKKFVISHYRLFQMSENTNTKMLRKAILLFVPFRKGLPKHYQLDALSRLGDYCCTLGEWKEVGTYAEELLKHVNSVIKDEMAKKKRGNGERIDLINHKSSLVAYYWKGYLLKTISLEKQGHYEQAKKFISSFDDNWPTLFDESVQVEVAKFKKLALLNKYRLNILMGNISFLQYYIEFLGDNPTEILTGLITIVEAANKHEFSVDSILENLSEKIDLFHNYHDSVNVDRHLQFRYQLAIYQFRNQRPQSGIKELLRCMTLATILNSSKALIRCVGLFEAYRGLATHQQEREFKKALEEVMIYERLKGRSQPGSKERPIIKH